MRRLALLALLLTALLPVLSSADDDPAVKLEAGGLDRSYLIHLPDPLPRVSCLLWRYGTAEPVAARARRR